MFLIKLNKYKLNLLLNFSFKKDINLKKPNPLTKKQTKIKMAGDKLRLLSLMRPAMAILPEISQPDKKAPILFFSFSNPFFY